MCGYYFLGLRFGRFGRYDECSFVFIQAPFGANIGIGFKASSTNDQSLRTDRLFKDQPSSTDNNLRHFWNIAR